MYKFKSHLMSMLAIAGMAFMTSCGDDTDPEPENNPVISLNGGTGFTSTDQTVVGGTPFTTQVTATQGASGTNLDGFRVTVSYDGAAAQTVIDSTDLTGSTFNYTFTRTTRYVAGTEKWTFTIIDNQNRSSSQSFTLTTTDPNAGATIDTYNAIMMGAQSNATYGSFLDANNGQVMFRLEANQSPANQAKVDIVYFYGATNQATLAAPDDASFGAGSNLINIGPHGWTTRNATRFIKLPSGSGSLFTNADDGQDLESAYAPTSQASSKANLLSTGDVVAFKTADGKYGLARVETLSTGTNGSIKLNIKVQQ